MSERGPEINVSTEQVSKVVTLSREIARIKVLDDRSPESNERASNFLKGNFNSQYESVEQMINLSQDPGRPEDDVAKKNAKQSLDLLGSALLLAGQDKKIENWVTGAEVYEHLPSNFAGVEKILQNNLLVSGNDDEVGKKIVEQLGALEKANRRAAMAPNSYKETKERETKKTIDSLFDVYESVDSDSEAGLKIGAVVGCLDSELAGEVVEVKKSNENRREETAKKNESEKKPFKTRAGAELKYASGDFPEKNDREGWLKYIEERLDVIENFKTNSIKDLALSDFTYPLLTMLAKRDGSVPEDILNIINTRLTLKEIGNRMAANSGSMDEHNGLVRCIVDLESNGFDMSPQVMEYFFKNKMDGLKTAEAWNLMEASNFRYVEMCDEALKNGSESIQNKIVEMGGVGEFLNFTKLKYAKDTWLKGQVRNYFLDTSGEEPRAAVLREYLIEKLINQAKAKGEKLSDYQARKSMQLAEFMYSATLETSVVDWDFVSGDEYSEAVNIGYLRILDGETGSKGKLTGPKSSLRHIESLTPGWLRSFSGIERPNKEITAEEIIKYGLEGKGRDRKSGLSGKELYSAHFISIISKKVWPARRLVLSGETPLTKDILKTQYFQGVNDYFNKVDTQVGHKGVTKTAWLAGLIELTFTGRDSGWTSTDYLELKNIVTKDIISGEGDDKPRSFVTKEQWEWIEKTLDLKKMIRMKRTSDIITAVIGGSGKKR